MDVATKWRLGGSIFVALIGCGFVYKLITVPESWWNLAIFGTALAVLEGVIQLSIWRPDLVFRFLKRLP